MAAYRTAAVVEDCLDDREGAEVTFATAEGAVVGLGGVLLDPFDDRRIDAMIDDLEPAARRARWGMRCRTLAAIFAERGITRVRYFSLDCEGCELRTVMGIDFTAVAVDVFTIESWPHGRAAGDFLVAERNYVETVEVGAMAGGAETVVVRRDLELPGAACDAAPRHPRPCLNFGDRGPIRPVLFRGDAGVPGRVRAETSAEIGRFFTSLANSQ